MTTPTHRKRGLRSRRLKPLPVRSLAPNILTVLGLCVGLTAIRFALEERYEAALSAIVIAALLDGLDGRVARLLKGATRFGAELDSLSDFANFGIVPVMVLYVWSLHSLGGVGWIVGLTFCICCALRLARFNVALEDPDRPAWKRNYFVGVPAPSAAGLIISPMFLDFLGFHSVREWPIFLALYVAMISFLMISQIPTFSGKGLRVTREQVLPLLLLVALFAAMMLIYPWQTLTGSAVVYLISIPLAVINYRKNDRMWKNKIDSTDADECVE